MFSDTHLKVPECFLKFSSRCKFVHKLNLSVVVVRLPFFCFFMQVLTVADLFLKVLVPTPDLLLASSG